MAKEQVTWQLTPEVLEAIRKEYELLDKKCKKKAIQVIADDRLRKAYNLKPSI